jgi:diguanylate cyclase (GGDEF)-like protein
MTSGYLQGEAAAKLGLEILYGNSLENLPVGIEGGNQMVFDFNAMQRFHLPVEKLPKEAIVKNIKYSKQKNVLILNSYSADSAWTRSIMSGLEEHFVQMGSSVNTFVEFMDTKRYSSSPYLLMLSKLLAHKYAQTKLDAIIVSDDNAYNFVLHQRQTLFKDVPLIFCGVNYLEDTRHLRDANITGVVESYDILGTLQLGLKLFPETKKILVINDETTTGKSNHQRLTEVLPRLPEGIEVEFAENTSMFALQRRLGLLDEKTLVLLMSFTKDKNNHLFSYQQSVEMITQASVRPVLGFWDFYVGEGILGGVITSGNDQGEAAANLAMAILNGEEVSSLPLITESPERRILDYKVLQRFGLEDLKYPEDIVIFNKPPSLMDDYAHLIYTVAGIIVLLVFLVATQSRKIFFQKKRQMFLAEKAETDPLTGTKNREYLMDYLNKQIEVSVSDRRPLVVCYFDLDNLKQVNDIEGHKAGDKYLLNVVETLQSRIRAADVLCRIGGDEFVVVLPRCSTKKIENLWDCINNDIQLKKQSGMITAKASISYGYAELDPYSPVTPEVLIETADHNMYAHKMSKKAQLPGV